MNCAKVEKVPAHLAIWAEAVLGKFEMVAKVSMAFVMCAMTFGIIANWMIKSTCGNGIGSVLVKRACKMEVTKSSAAPNPAR